MLTPRASRDLVCLDQLGADGLGAEVFERVGFNRVDAQLGVGLDDGEAAGDWIGLIMVRYIYIYIHTDGDIRKKLLLPALSSMTSMTPGRSCSMDGTWLARTPISPDSAGMLTWMLCVGAC